jgi:hypothetical protein
VFVKREAIMDENNQERYQSFRLFGSQGSLVAAGQAADLTAGLTMPETPGTYYLILDGRGGRRAIQIAVGQKRR